MSSPPTAKGEGVPVNSLAGTPFDPNAFTLVGRVEPPEKGLFTQLGPKAFPAGIYMPDGYDLEESPRPDGWVVLRARDVKSGQVMTQWAVHRKTEEVDLAHILVHDLDPNIDPLDLPGAGDVVDGIDLMETS